MMNKMTPATHKKKLHPQHVPAIQTKAASHSGWTAQGIRYNGDVSDMKSLLLFFTAPPPPRLVLFLSCLLTASTWSCWAWQECSPEQGGICPAGDTCCATSTPGVSTCISGKVKELGGGGGEDAGSCCLDDDDNDKDNGSNNTPPLSFATTGCGVGFQCAKDHPANSSSSSYRYCQRIDNEDDENPPRLPRYRLCSLPDKALKELYGFPVAPYVTMTTTTTTPTSTEQQQDEEDSPLLFAYYSNMGPIDNSTDDDDVSSNKFAKVKKVVIVIHGSSRNADDYLCCMNAALPPVPGRTHNHVDPSNSTILIISPWFLALADLPVNITSSTASTTISAKSPAKPLVWAQFGPIEHTWRYGADALNANVSSYAAIDAIVDYIVTARNHNDENRLRFENLRDIIVIGHSAGGQYTQRWALLSNSTAFATTTTSTDTAMMQIKKPSIRVIVANPKAFAYLDNRRYFLEEQDVANPNNSTNSMTITTSMSFRIPDEDSLKKCPDYDEWEWGFSKTREGHDDFLPTPYKDRAIAAAAASANANGTYESGVQVIVERYGLQRNVIYLAGQLDVLVNGNRCHESIQGDYRRQRSFRFFKSLSEIYNKKSSSRHIHYRLVVHGVHHDHCLMFQSPEGQQAMFGNFHDDTTTTATSATT